jgi:hypothetical protein
LALVAEMDIPALALPEGAPPHRAGTTARGNRDRDLQQNAEVGYRER